VNRCVFFDRDGVVNKSPGPGYVERLEDFHLQPGFVAAARVARDRGYGVAVATNQRGVARGIVSMQTIEAIHAHLIAELARQGIALLGVFCCPHERDTCTCRKPQPGLLLAAAQAHNLDLGACWMVGDSETDIEAGRRAGCRTVLIADKPGTKTRATLVAETIDSLAAVLEQALEPTDSDFFSLA
jgi:D-glycero-D-manno-heptose 1,7-bisphosphate phosphatase